MSEIPLITIVVVTAAAPIYCIEGGLKAVTTVSRAVLTVYDRKVNDLHDATFNGIEPTFEF